MLSALVDSECINGRSCPLSDERYSTVLYCRQFKGPVLHDVASLASLTVADVDSCSYISVAAVSEMPGARGRFGAIHCL